MVSQAEIDGDQTTKKFILVMSKSAAILDPDGADVTNLPLTQPGNLREPRSPATKFLYPSGSRPLDGYTIKRGIGRGGFGEVYYATSDGGKEVALKLIRRNLDVELRGVAHCINLKHPNLLALFDIRRDADDDTWVVMEYVGGETLDQAILRRADGMPLDEAVTWMHGIASGVGYLHDHGIVHRDLKPGNIFCDEGLVKLGDYGLSKFISTSRRSGQTESVGTVHYMAPEVANGRYGKEIDIYALGVILYEILTGRVPFEGESVGEVLMKHLTAKPDVSMLAEPFRPLVERMLDKDPANRPQSVTELMSALPKPQASPGYSFASVNLAPPPAPAPAQQNPAPVVAARAVPSVAESEEPIWKAIKENWNDLSAAWRDADLHIFLRIVIIVLAAIVVLSTSWTWVPAVVIYAIYRVVRSIMLSSGKSLPTPVLLGSAPPAASPHLPLERGPQASPAAVNGPATPQFDPRPPESAALVEALPRRSSKESFTDLISSLLMSAMMVLVSCFVINAVFIRLDPGEFAWLALLSTTGAWFLLICASMWEHNPVDESRRRAILLLGGVSLGFYAWMLAQTLVVDLPYSLNPYVRTHVPALNGAATTRSLFDSYGKPTLVGYLAYFGVLFLGPRWWRLTDALRKRRVSLWRTACYGMWAWVLCWFWPFPDQFAIATTVTMVLAAQLASPWRKASFRDQWRRC